MKAIDLFDFVIGEQQKSCLVGAIPEKQAHVRSEEFFQRLKESILVDGYAEATAELVKVVENHDIHNAKSVLNREVKDGFWVYSFTCSADYHELRWCADENRAIQEYNALELAYFLCHKYIIHTEKGVVLKQTLNDIGENNNGT